MHMSMLRETGKGCAQTATTKFTRHVVALASPSLDLTVDQKYTGLYDTCQLGVRSQGRTNNLQQSLVLICS